MFAKYRKFYFNPGETLQLWYLPLLFPSVDSKVDGGYPDESVPLVLVHHGGPQGAILNSWSYRWNLSCLAARCFGVVAVNFHGSTG
jgi:dipeptidyl aminopeptidase/acylaminoacyl peptidase